MSRSNGGIDRLCQQVADRAAARTLMAFENWSVAESPIERLLLVGMFSLLDEKDWRYAPLNGCEIATSGQASALNVRNCVNNPGTVLIEMQRRLLDWPADFVLSCPSLSEKLVIVECDGHDFHERTKEQAARDRSRDRAAQAAGYMMLRYTGSEIYRDPLGCAESAIRALANLLDDEDAR